MADEHAPSGDALGRSWLQCPACGAKAVRRRPWLMDLSEMRDAVISTVAALGDHAPPPLPRDGFGAARLEQFADITAAVRGVGHVVAAAHGAEQREITTAERTTEEAS